DIYRARWQIELVFKSLKSYLNIDKIGNPGQYQLECLIYGRLITSIIIFKIYNILYPITYKHFKRGVSLLLFVKLLKSYNNIFSQNITCSIMTINLLKNVFEKVSKRSLHDKRRRKTTLELLQEYLIPKINFHNVA
ncbi:transposase, partial [Maledivibacter halophilus]